MIMNKKRVLAISSDIWGCGQYRILQPTMELALRYNNNPLSKFEFKYLTPHMLPVVTKPIIDKFDIVIMQRAITQQAKEVFEYAKSKNKIMITEVDDDLFNIDPANPFSRAMKGRKFKAIYRDILKQSDFITVSTPEIKQTLLKLVPEDKIKVFENAIWEKHPLLTYDKSRRNEMPNNKIIFGWQGGSSHLNDINNIQSAVSELLDKYPHTLFAFCSHQSLFDQTFTNFVDFYKQRIITIPPITDDFNNFPNLPSMYDIGLAPLKLSKFNECKSWLKYLEWGIWGVPAVGSPIADYKRFVEKFGGDNNSKIITKDNSKEEWVDKVSYFIENVPERFRIGEEIRDFILNNLTLKHINNKRMDFYKEIIK